MASGLALPETGASRGSRHAAESRRKVQESFPAFCGLVGYDVLELLGKRFADVPASRSLDMSLHLSSLTFRPVSYSLNVFVHRDGHAVVVRNDCSLFVDMSIEAVCDVHHA
jgi:hypothetical protein